MYSDLDETDVRMLDLLQRDARLTNKEIAFKLKKSVTPVYERIRWLEKEGFIQRYVAVLDKNKIDKKLVAYTNVKLKEQALAMLKSFEKSIVEFREVMECNHVSGNYDYLLKVVVRDIEEYQQFVMNKLAKLPNIGTVQSGFVMTEIKHETAYELKMPEKKVKRR